MLVWLIRSVENYISWTYLGSIWRHGRHSPSQRIKKPGCEWKKGRINKTVRRELALKTRSYAARLMSDQIILRWLFISLLFPIPQNFSKKRPGEPFVLLSSHGHILESLAFLRRSRFFGVWAHHPLKWPWRVRRHNVIRIFIPVVTRWPKFQVDIIGWDSFWVDAHKGCCFFLKWFFSVTCFWKMFLFGSLNFTHS